MTTMTINTVNTAGPTFPKLLCMITCLASAGCREYAVEDMMEAYDDYREIHYDALVEAYEQQGMTPPSHREFIDPAKWVWGNGTKRRACIVEKGKSERYRDHPYMPCMENFFRDEDGPFHEEMRTAVEFLITWDIYALYQDTCRFPDGASEPFPHLDCSIPED